MCDGIEGSLSGGELVAEAFAQGGKSDLAAGIAALYNALARKIAKAVGIVGNRVGGPVQRDLDQFHKLVSVGLVDLLLRSSGNGS
jgi:hypothetical protein